MPIRFKSAIDNAMPAIENEIEQKVRNIQEETQRILDKIMVHKDDMVDVIDTFRYIKEKKLQKYLPRSIMFVGDECGRIGIDNSKIMMQYNNWKKENTGPYNWYVAFENGFVVVYCNNDCSTVETMILNAEYNKERNYVVLPIPHKGSNLYTNTNSSKPMAALKLFSEQIGPFCEKFFNEVTNIKLK